MESMSRYVSPVNPAVSEALISTGKLPAFNFFFILDLSTHCSHSAFNRHLNVSLVLRFRSITNQRTKGHPRQEFVHLRIFIILLRIRNLVWFSCVWNLCIRLDLGKCLNKLLIVLQFYSTTEHV